MYGLHDKAKRQMAARSSMGRRGKGVNVGRPDVSGVGAIVPV